MTRQEIFDQVEQERHYQDKKWGADENNSPFHWAAYIGAYTNRSLTGVPGTGEQEAAFKADMIRVAALAVAAIEKL